MSSYTVVCPPVSRIIKSDTNREFFPIFDLSLDMINHQGEREALGSKNFSKEVNETDCNCW